MEHLAKEGLEDEYLDEIMDRMDRLEKLWAPEEGTTATPQGILPQYAPIWNQIPENYRGVADSAVKWVSGISLQDALSDPTGQKLKQVMEKAGPWIERIGGLDALKRFLPKELAGKQPATLPPASGMPSDPYYKLVE